MDKLNTKKIGSAAEDQACNYLQAQGLQVIARNYYCALGEIDIIMQDEKEVVFVEVRSRNKNSNNTIESVDLYKQKKLIKTATHFLHRKGWSDSINCRFDVIGINNMQLEWIKNAFYADNF
jgi:putative endonuclease